MSCTAKPYFINSTGTVALGDPTAPSAPVTADVHGLYDAIASAFVNDATVTLEAIRDADTQEDITGHSLTLPVTMDYVADSNGVYSVDVDEGLALAKGQRVEFEIKAIKSARVFTFYLLRHGAKAGSDD